MTFSDSCSIFLNKIKLIWGKYNVWQVHVFFVSWLDLGSNESILRNTLFTSGSNYTSVNRSSSVMVCGLSSKLVQFVWLNWMNEFILLHEPSLNAVRILARRSYLRQVSWLIHHFIYLLHLVAYFILFLFIRLTFWFYYLEQFFFALNRSTNIGTAV